MSSSVTGTDDLKGVPQSGQPTSASVGSRPISTAPEETEPRPPEVSTGNPFTKGMPGRTVLSSSDAPPEPEPPPKPSAEPSAEPEPDPELQPGSPLPVLVLEPPPAPQMSSEERQLDASINAILAQNSISLGQCNSTQHSYIIQYGMDMIADGNKPEFAAQVCASMAILYQSGIDGTIPETALPLKTIYNIDDIKKRAEIKELLSNTMSRYGADYTIISKWLESQQGNSWSPASKGVKYYLLQQCANADEIDGRFYLKQHEFKSPKAAVDNLRSNYESFMKQHNVSDKCYAQSIAMYKAFTAIVLAKTKVESYIFPDQQKCKVVRGDNLKSMQKDYPGEPWVRPRGNRGELTFSDKIRGGIADSTALGAAASGFSGTGIATRTFMMPFSRIMAVYFISPELCCDPGGTASAITEASITQSIKQLKDKYGREREVICDFSCLPSTIPPI